MARHWHKEESRREKYDDEHVKTGNKASVTVKEKEKRIQRRGRGEKSKENEEKEKRGDEQEEEYRVNGEKTESR